MRCIIVDDEPIARIGMKNLIDKVPQLELIGCFDSAESASEFMQINKVDLLFLDIQMPGISGIEFAKDIPKSTLVIFTTAYSEYALESYEVDAIDYLVKPIEQKRFTQAVTKAISYHALLLSEEIEEIENIKTESIFVRSERKYCKVNFKDILFIEALKDYIIIQTDKERTITKMSLKQMDALLPDALFFRINRSYIINLDKIDSFDNNDVFIKETEIGIGAKYKESFFTILSKKQIN